MLFVRGSTLRTWFVSCPSFGVGNGPCRARVIVTNSGNANACTGSRGNADTKAMAADVARELGVEAEQVLVMSTGIIGESSRWINSKRRFRRRGWPAGDRAMAPYGPLMEFDD